MAPRNASLALQELGERIMPSVAGIEPIDHGIVSKVSHSNHPLHGTCTAKYHGPAVNIDIGTNFALKGRAKLDTLGSFNVTGAIQGVGNIAHGRATGDLVLSNSHGTITLHLHGSVQPSFGPIPHDVVYTVSKGTGDFQHLTGYGSIGIKLTPSATAPGKAPTGAIAMTFS